MTDTRTPEGYEARTPAEAWEHWLSHWTPDEFWAQFQAGDQSHPWDHTARGAVTNYCDASLNDGGATETDLPTMAERDLLAEYLRQHCPEATEAATTPSDAYERWVGGQSVSEFVGNDSPEQAVDSYITEITASPHGGPVAQYGAGPTARERQLLIQYVTAHTPRGSDQLSLSAVAEILGVTRQAINNRVRRGTFPAPDGRLREPAGDRPYWLRETVEEYRQTK